MPAFYNKYTKDIRANVEEGVTEAINCSSENSASVSAAGNATLKEAQENITIDHYRPLEMDAESMRIVLRRQDQYCNELKSRMWQLSNQIFLIKLVRPSISKFALRLTFSGPRSL